MINLCLKERIGSIILMHFALSLSVLQTWLDALPTTAFMVESVPRWAKPFCAATAPTRATRARTARIGLPLAHRTTASTAASAPSLAPTLSVIVKALAITVTAVSYLSAPLTTAGTEVSARW